MDLNVLIQWSQKDFAHLPWRRNRTLYRTLVSEIMLQQTTVSTVKNHYDRFLKKFPDLESLASATEQELLIAWKGLGYYRRARNLKKIAEHIVHHHKGIFPKTTEELEKIPGIGPYTSQALIGIGCDKRGLAIDANLERVIARLYGLEVEKGIKLQKKIRELWEENKIFSSYQKSYRLLNEALMDLGRIFCQARKASCELCPLRKDCTAFREKNPTKYPIEKKIVSGTIFGKNHNLQLLRLIITKKDKILVYKKSEKEWLTGQYEVPTFILSCTDQKLKQYPFLKKGLELNSTISFKTTITKYKITNLVLLANEKQLKRMDSDLNWEWKDMVHESSNLSTATLKALKILEKNREQE